MNSKKIVVISRTIFPFQAPRSFRATELAKELARQGHDVTLYGVLGNYDYTDFERQHNIKVKNLGKMRFATLNSSNDVKSSLLNKIFSRLIHRLIEFPDIELMFKVFRCLKQDKDIDLLVTVAVPYPLHWGAASYIGKRKNNFKGTWVADCGDPYFGNKFHKRYFYFKYVEKWFCRIADFITVPIEEAKEGYFSEFHDKIKVIPQGFDFNEVTLSDTEPNNPVPLFIYAGAFYKGMRDPELFLNYLTTVKTDFKFIVYTKNKEMVEPFIEKLAGKLLIKDYIPRIELLKIMNGASFLVNVENGTAMQSPSKLIDYLLTKRPILSVNSHTLNEPAINEFLNGNYSSQLVIENLDQYDIKNVAGNFVKLMK
ncbi:MAG TPA: glycosyltransferase [Mucilaginibacter sp.]